MALSQTLTSLAASVTVSADKDAVVYDERTHVAELHIPAGAVPEDTEITMTEYVKGAKVEAIMPVCRQSTARLTVWSLERMWKW